MLDPEANFAEVSRWVLHQNIAGSAQHLQECAGINGSHDGGLVGGRQFLEKKKTLLGLIRILFLQYHRWPPGKLRGVPSEWSYNTSTVTTPSVRPSVGSVGPEKEAHRVSSVSSLQVFLSLQRRDEATSVYFLCVNMPCPAQFAAPAGDAVSHAFRSLCRGE